MKPSRKRELATDLMDRFGASKRKACAVIQFSRVMCLYQSSARDSSALIMRMKEITQTRVHYGYRRVHVMLKREGFKDNHKRVYRLYRGQGWSLRQKRPKPSKTASAKETSIAHQPNMEHGLCSRQPVRWAQAAHSDGG